MDLVTQLIISFLLIAFLVKSADIVEESLVIVAHKLKLSIFVVGFFVLSWASSLPELAVSIGSLAGDVPDISVGNLLGASFVLLTLIIGANTLKHKELPFKGRFGIVQLLLTLVVISLPLISISDGELGQSEGLLLIAGYSSLAVYIMWLGRKGDSFKHRKGKQASYQVILKAMFGAILLMLISHLLVGSVTQLAFLLGISETLIGLLILGIGTNLPEITILLRSKGKEQEKLAAGNFLGSASVNTALLGIIAFMRPHFIENMNAVAIIIVSSSVSLVIFFFLAVTGKKLTSREGLILLALFVFWFIAEFINLVQNSSRI